MLDKIMDLIRNSAGSALTHNSAVPSDKSEEAIKQGGNSILDTLKNALAGGRLNDVLGYFKSGGTGSNDIVNEATFNYSKDLQNNIGLNQEQANDVASKV